MSSIFISNLNSYLGQCLLEEISQLPLVSISGSLSSSEESKYYSSSVTVIQSSDLLAYNAALMSSDVIIYDMHTVDLDHLQDKAKMLKIAEFSSKKTLILISSVQVWGATTAKIVEKSSEEIAEMEDPEGDKTKVAEFEENEYMKRKAPEEFKAWKGCETLAMSIGMNKPELDVYVLAAGVIYGNGEQDLEYLFKSAWLEEPAELPIIGNGNNCVPSIHVRDLARCVKHIIQVPPPSHYLFAVDSSPSQLQKDLVKGISQGVGTGKVKNVNFEEFQSEKWAKAMSLNVKVKPSSFFLPPNEEEKEEEEEEEELEEDGEPKPKKPKPIRMQWHCLGGLVKEIRKINVEFNESRNLKPITVVISGPPGSGKSFLASELSNFYNIPRIHTSWVASHVVDLQSDLGEAIRTRLAELKEEMLEEAENNKKDDEEINPDTIKPRIPKDLLAQAFKWALNQNPCRNRGYILDGYPKNYDDAWSLFKTMPPPKEGDDPDNDDEPDRAKMITDLAIFPQSLIDLEGSDREIIEKIKALPEEIIQNTHYNPKDMQRRLQEYRKFNNDPTGLPSVTDFYEENNIEVLSLHCNDKLAFEASKIYLERFGKPNNYQTHHLTAEEKRRELVEKKKIAEEMRGKEVNKKQEDIEVDKRIMKNEDIRKKISLVQQKEIDNIERLAEHVKGYMLENVYDVLAVGLTKVCIKKRDDPIDYLARYLFKHADGIPHPDPFLY